MKKFIPAILIALFIVILFVYIGKMRDKKKDKYAQAIIDLGAAKQTSFEFLKTLDAGFLLAWINGINTRSVYFTYNGKRYATQGGKAA